MSPRATGQGRSYLGGGADRDLVIAVLIKRLHDEFGRPYAPPSKDSACHVAAERLKEPVETVRAIWRKNKQDVRAAMDKMPSLG